MTRLAFDLYIWELNPGQWHWELWDDIRVGASISRSDSPLASYNDAHSAAMHALNNRATPQHFHTHRGPTRRVGDPLRISADTPQEP